MKTLYININGESIKNANNIEVIGSEEDSIVESFYISLGEAIAGGVTGIKYKPLVADFANAKPNEFNSFSDQWQEVKSLLLGENPSGDYDFTLSSEYLDWLKMNATYSTIYYKKYQNQHQAKVKLNLDELYEDTVDAIRRKVIRFLQTNDNYKNFDEFVVNDDVVARRSLLVRSIKSKFEEIAFVLFEKWESDTKERVEKEKAVCPNCGNNPCECNIDSIGQKHFVVFKEETGGTLYYSMSHKEWGLYNKEGEICLPIGRYEQIYNKNYPDCFKKAFNWFKQIDGQSYYYLSDNKCIKLGDFADATPLNEQYLAVKKNEDSEFTCVIDSDGKEIIGEGNIGSVVGINSEGNIVCETAPGIWGVKNIHTSNEIPFMKMIDPDSCKMNPYYHVFYIHTYIKGKKNSGRNEIIHIEGNKIKYYKEHFEEAFFTFNGNFYESFKRDEFLKGYYENMVVGDRLIDNFDEYYGFEGIIDDIAYRNYGTKDDKNDYGFSYLPTGLVRQGLQMIFKIGNYCIVSKKDSEFRRSRQCDQCGIIDISTGEKIVGTHYDVIYYLSQFIERPIFLLEEEDKLTLFDPQKNKRVKFRCSCVVNILYADGIINVIDQRDNGRNALLIFDIDGNILYHDKWGMLDVNSLEDELTPCFHTFKNGQPKEHPKDYTIVKTGETMGVLDSSGNSIVPSIYGDVKLFRPLNSYCRDNGIAVFMDNWDIIDKFII